MPDNSRVEYIKRCTSAHLHATYNEGKINFFDGRWVNPRVLSKIEADVSEELQPEDSLAEALKKLKEIKSPLRLGIKPNELYYVTLQRIDSISSILCKGVYYRISNKNLVSPLENGEVKKLTVQYTKVKGKLNLLTLENKPLLQF